MYREVRSWGVSSRPRPCCRRLGGAAAENRFTSSSCARRQAAEVCPTDGTKSSHELRSVDVSDARYGFGVATYQSQNTVVYFSGGNMLVCKLLSLGCTGDSLLDQPHLGDAMQSETGCRLVLAALVLALALPLSLQGQQPFKRSDGDQDGSQATSEADVARELATLKETVHRLETKVDRLLEQPSEFSRVEVRIVDEEGLSMSGFEVELTSSKQAQRAKASGVSNDKGIVLTRHLPYGAYRMGVSGNGWHAHDLVTVEVGQPLELSIVAPTPGQHGNLLLKAALPDEALEGLRFGGRKLEQQDGGWATMIAPEPQREPEELVVQEQASSGWKTFPTVSDGIETVAVIVEINNIHRQTEQPDGSKVTWEWRPDSADEQDPPLRWLVQSDDTLRPLWNVEEKRKQFGSQVDWFGAVASADESAKDQSTGSSRERGLGYYDLELGEEQRGETTVELPAGQIELSIDELYGRPSNDVLQTIVPTESTAGQVWLRAVVKGDSEWFRRVLDSNWSAPSGRFARGFSRALALSASETQSVNVGRAKTE